MGQSLPEFDVRVRSALGGELGGLGAGYDIWSVNGQANWPF
jgi:hypothetical protein